MPLKDLTGKKFNRLTVLERDMSKDSKHVYWLCRCDCGKILSVRGNNLTGGTTKSCGCLNLEKIHMKRRNSEDITGKTFNNLKVIRYVDSNQNGTLWEVQCLLCGKIKILPAAWIKKTGENLADVLQKRQRKIILKDIKIL